MAEAVYLLCAATSLACTLLLMRAYRSNRSRLLLWSSLCFVGLALNNLLLVVDLLLVPGMDFYPVRASAALAGMALLMYGLIWDAR